MIQDCIIIRVTEEKLLFYMNHYQEYTVAELGPRFGYTSADQLKEFEIILTKVCQKKLTYNFFWPPVGLSKRKASGPKLKNLKRRRLN